MSFNIFGLVKDVLRIPHPVSPGLQRIGEPGPRSPVVATGNFGLTVRRVRRALAGRDVWLLVANSKGINVWCASAGGHFTHHSIIAALRASRIDDHVEHRDLILPQLSATGIERHKITEATGWTARWGPARLEDLPDVLDRGGRVRRTERLMRFPLWERLELAGLLGVPLSAIALLLLGLLFGGRTGGVAAGGTFLVIASLFAGLPRLRITGGLGWLTFLAMTAVTFLLEAGALVALAAAGPTHLLAVGIENVVAMLVVTVDLSGMTPLYPSSIILFRNKLRVNLVEEACAGSAECVQVCPINVIQMNGRRRKVEIARPDDCVRCGACIVQCPRDALRFRSSDGRIVQPATVRSSKLNMMGRRTVQ
jgi:ferredoxin